MDQTQPKKHKKKDKKPIYLLLGFLIFFGFFIYFITRPSLQNKAIDQIEVCNNVDDVKSIFDYYKFELLENDENGNKIVAIDFQDAVRKKLSSFNLDDNELKKCLQWLPPTKTNINVIIIPDLSRRIIDSVNNPNQIINDKFVLNTLWQSFVDFTKLKQDTKDRLIVDVTDIDQAKGQFGNIANKLQFDLSTHKGRSNRLYFTDDKKKQFENAVDEMYKSAKQRPLGADYVSYFRRHLVNRLKKPTLFENYINKVIIITDGYLEAEGKPSYTKILSNAFDYRPFLYPAVQTGNVIDVINSKQLNIPKLSKIDLSNSDVLVCEVYERRFLPFTNIPYNGMGNDFDILEAYWKDWLKRMGAKDPKFISREQANELTQKQIEIFFNNNL